NVLVNLFTCILSFHSLFFFPLILPPPPTSTLFPYTTLFRSPYPTTGQLATAEGSGAAFNIAAALNGKDLKPFIYHSMGTVASLGQNHGIAEITDKNLKFKGPFASLLKHLSADRGIMEIAGIKTAIKKGTI